MLRETAARPLRGGTPHPPTPLFIIPGLDSPAPICQNKLPFRPTVCQYINGVVMTRGPRSQTPWAPRSFIKLRSKRRSQSTLTRELVWRHREMFSCYQVFVCFKMCPKCYIKLLLKIEVIPQYRFKYILSQRSDSTLSEKPNSTNNLLNLGLLKKHNTKCLFLWTKFRRDTIWNHQLNNKNESMN